MTFKYNLTIEATSKSEATSKMQALAKLASRVDAKTLTALADKGPALLSNPKNRSFLNSLLGLG